MIAAGGREKKSAKTPHKVVRINTTPTYGVRLRNFVIQNQKMGDPGVDPVYFLVD